MTGFVAYLNGRIEMYFEDFTHKMYMADGIKMVSENTARYAGGGSLKKRFAEILDMNKKPADDRSGDDIFADVVKKAGIKVI